jgi:hypothetical protein
VQISLLGYSSYWDQDRDTPQKEGDGMQESSERSSRIFVSTSCGIVEE